MLVSYNKICCIILILLAFFSGCSKDGTNSGKIRIVTTTSILGDLVSEILPDTFEVTVLMGPGVDPHLFKAAQGDVQTLGAADLIIYNGLHLEGKMAEVLNKLSTTGNTYAFAEALDKRHLRLLDSNSRLYDPHIWMDVRLQIKAVEELLRMLRARYPHSESEIRDQGLDLLNRLNALDIWCRETLSVLPDSSRVLVSSHDAFSYFGRSYGMEVRSLVGISTLAEPGLRDVTELVDYISSRGIRAVFVENSVSPRALTSVVEGCIKKGHPVRIGGELYSDALGEKNGPAGTYEGMIRSNVQQIVQALQ